MRILSLIATLVLTAGIFLFTRGSGWHWGFMIPGALIALFGALMLALVFSAATSRSHRGAKARAMARRPGARSVRLRQAGSAAA